MNIRRYNVVDGGKLYYDNSTILTACHDLPAKEGAVPYIMCVSFTVPRLVHSVYGIDWLVTALIGYLLVGYGID